MRLNRAWLGALLAICLAGGPAGPAQAAIISNDITGTNSQVDFACLGLIVGFTLNNCYWDGVNTTAFPFTGASGPVQLAGYYAVGQSPWDKNGAPGDIGGIPGGSFAPCTPGGSNAPPPNGTDCDPATPDPLPPPTPVDPKYSVPLSGTVSIDDKGTPCDADDTITATISYGAAKRNFAGGPGTQGEESWGDGDLSFDLAETVVDSATPNAAGGCDYVIGSAGFPTTIPTATVNGATQQYGDDVNIGIDPTIFEIPWDPVDGTGNYAGISPSISSVEQGAPNVGAPMTTSNGPGYVCQFFNGAVAACAPGGAHHEVVDPLNPGDTTVNGERALIENSIWSVSTDAVGNITAARVFPVNEDPVGTLNEEEWDSPMWNFTGTCNNCFSAADDSASTFQNVPATIDVLANDIGLSATVTLAPDANSANGGTVAVNGLNPGDPAQLTVTYTPASNFTGQDTFNYTVTLDDNVTSDTATVTVTVNPLGANPDTATTRLNTPVNIDVMANDAGFADPVTVTISRNPDAGGSAVVNNSPGPQANVTITLTPSAALGTATYTETFDYTVVDNNNNTGTATVTVTVQNQLPNAGNGGTINIDTQGVDPATVSGSFDVSTSAGYAPGDLPSTVSEAAAPANGSTSVNGTVVSYTPSSSFFTGSDSFDYAVTDADNEVSTATVTVNIADAMPAVTDTNADATDGSSSNFSVPVTLGNGSATQHQLSVAGGPTGGTTANGGSVSSAGISGGALALSYTPAAGFTGSDSFTVTLTDGDGDAATGTVTINVAASPGSGIKLPGGSGAVGPWGLLLLAVLPLLRRRRRH